MRRNLISLLCFLVIINLSFTQAPGIEWQNTIGGTKTEYPTALINTVDGGHLVCGYSESPISTDKSEGVTGGGSTNYDYWIVKLNSTGLIEWENTIGGILNDYLWAAIETDDGGYLIGGESNSEISGDKTEPPIGGGDIWLIKLDATGNIVWQKCYGGTENEVISTIVKTSDGNYILGASSYSGISGNKTELHLGYSDFWILKIDESGNILWQNTIGGNYIDDLENISSTQDNGLIICGYSTSDISGDKTENKIGSGDAIGNGDYWIIKLDSIGNIIWQNTIGGNDSDRPCQTLELPDGTYISFGHSGSDISGDKTTNNLGGTNYAYQNDIWILKLGSDGNILWDKIIGGNDDDDLESVIRSEDDMFILLGNSKSPISNDKTKPLVGNYDMWLMKIDHNANIIWQVDFGGSLEESRGEVCPLNDGSFITACGSKSSITGNKTESLIGLTDIWVVKFEEDDCIPQPYYFDFDNDGVGSGVSLANVCELPVLNTTFLTGDCNPEWGIINPSEPEICDGYDNDCDGLIDEDILVCNSGPLIEWQNTIGGSNGDDLAGASLTDDGGLILASYSSSLISVDKTVSTGGDDYWILKLNSLGLIEWQKAFGTNQQDIVTSITPTSDGGYITAGFTSAGINGNKTDISNGSYDYWILKLNSIGEIEWQTGIGGILEDKPSIIIQANDGGYLVGGTSKSPISGDKSEGFLGGLSDIWLVKLNSTGNIEWQNTIGGTGDDYITSMIQNDDGSYLLGCYTNSGISFDKSEPNFGIIDIWLIKINSSGNIIWENTIGGTGSENPLSILKIEGGYLIGGGSSSNISGDKASNCYGVSDAWLLKVNETGEIIWQQIYGGIDIDWIASIWPTSDGNYLLGSNSASPVSGNKYTHSLGYDYWVIKIDTSGNIMWERSVGADGTDRLISAFQSDDQGFVLAGYTWSDNSGYKIEPDNFPGPPVNGDLWIIKLFSDCDPSTEVCNSLDDNCNGLIDDAITETISIYAGGPITFCQGGNVLLTATYSGATVQWKKNGVNIPGATSPTYLVTTKATYTCVTTSPCGTATSAGIFVNVNKNPPASITAAGATTFCAGGSVVLTANAGGGLSYQWYKGASLIAGATSINYTATLGGNYKCRVTKTATGCFKNSNVINVSVPCKEGELMEDENSFSIYPNPNEGTFTIEANVMRQDFASLESTIEIYNNLGQLIYSKEINSNDGLINETIEIKNIIPGIYIVKLWNNNIQNVKNIIIE